MKESLKKTLAMTLCLLMVLSSFAIAGFKLPETFSLGVFAEGEGEGGEGESDGESGTYGDNIKWSIKTEAEGKPAVLTVELQDGATDTAMKAPTATDYPGWWDSDSYNSDIGTVVLKGITEICDYAFTHCNGLTSVRFSGAESVIGVQAFKGCLNLKVDAWPTDIAEIKESAFESCRSLTALDIMGSIGVIGKRAFYDCRGITSICVTGSVGEIGEEAFYFCNGLTSITFPGNVGSIDKRGFYSCASLTSVKVTGSLTSVGEEAFYDCENLRSFSVAGSFEEIGKKAFYNCSNLTDFTIPGELETIGELAFYKSGISNVSVPATTDTIGVGAFAECSKLSAIKVDAQNPNFCAVDGVLYNKNKTTLISYPAKKETQKFQLPDTVTTIEEWAFSGCTAPSVMYVGLNLANVGDFAFQDFNTANLKDIYYEGTESDRDNIAIGANNDAFLNASWHYSHTHAPYTSIVVDPEPTCTNTGTKTGICICGKPMTEEMSDLGGHLWDEGEVTTEATCTVDGVRTFTCTRDKCGATKTETIPATGVHAWVLDDDAEQRPATCIAEGIESYKCSYGCGATRTENPSKVSHDMVESGDRQDATCGEDGWIDYVCSYGCGETERKIISKDTVAHKWVYQDTLVNGKTQRECSVCGKTEAVDLPAGVCGPDLRWEMERDTSGKYTGRLIITGTGAMYDFTVGSAPWYDLHNDITKVDFPNGITHVGNYAFYHCDNLTVSKDGEARGQMEFPVSLETIGDYAFYYCYSIQKVAIPASVTKIGKYAFYECNRLSSFEVTGELEEIGELAFYRCDGLTEMSVPASVVAIGKGAFADCAALKKISVTGTNANYCSVDGVLYNKDKTQLIAYPAGKQAAKFALEETTESILEWAFAGCGNIPGAIYAPASLGTVYENAFVDCQGTGTTVFFGGSEADKAAITVNSNTEAFLNEANWVFNHKHTGGNQTVYCTLNGKETGTCSDCGASYTKDLDPIGHQKPLKYTEAVEATCTKAGSKAYYECERCGNRFSDEDGTNEITAESCVIAKKEHVEKTPESSDFSWASDYSTCNLKIKCANCGEIMGQLTATITPENKEPTCTEDGGATYTARVEYKGEIYKDVQGDIKKALGHNPDKIVEQVNPTCGEEGYIDRECSRCGEIVRERLEALEHNYGEYKVTKEATCKEAGQQERTCANCGHVETTEIPKLEHVFDDGVATKEATFTEGGENTYTCTKCGYKEVRETPARTGITIAGYVPVKVVDYKTKVTYHAEVYGYDGVDIVWYNQDGKKIGSGKDCTVGWCLEDYTVTAVALKNGKVVSSSDTEYVQVNHSIIDILLWFFGHLFNPDKYVIDQR